MGGAGVKRAWGAGRAVQWVWGRKGAGVAVIHIHSLIGEWQVQHTRPNQATDPNQSRTRHPTNHNAGFVRRHVKLTVMALNNVQRPIDHHHTKLFCCSAGKGRGRCSVVACCARARAARHPEAVCVLRAARSVRACVGWCGWCGRWGGGDAG